jgi:NADH-quinone oxidoreductase subunit I
MQSAEAVDGRRYAEWFRINFSRCIFCGLCAEACPTLALQMTADFELSRRDVQELLFEKEQLLIDGCGKDCGYDFYKHCGIGVSQARGAGADEQQPVDVRRLVP